MSHGVTDADQIMKDSLSQFATWNGRSDLSALEVKPVKLRAQLKRAKLFSYQFR